MAAEATMDQVKEQVQETVEQTADKAIGGLRGQVEQRSKEVAEKISTQASDVRSLSEELRKQGKDGPADLAEQVAQRASRVGDWLAESDQDRLIEDVEDYARRNPWTVAAGALAVGFVASRFLKASSTERARSSASRAQLPAPTAATRPPERSGNGHGEFDHPGTPRPSGQL